MKLYMQEVNQEGGQLRLQDGILYSITDLVKV